jgi:hypothetical protein
MPQKLTLRREVKKRWKGRREWMSGSLQRFLLPVLQHRGKNTHTTTVKSGLCRHVVSVIG